MDNALRKRLDAGIALLASCFVLLLAFALHYLFETTVALLVVGGLVGYALYDD